MSNKTLKVFTSKFDGHYAGGAGVVVAEDKTEALELLKKEVSRHGLRKTSSELTEEHLEELDLTQSKAIVLENGDM